VSGKLNYGEIGPLGGWVKSLELIFSFLRSHWFLPLALVAQGVAFSSAWRSMYKTWSSQDFSHGVAIAPIALYLLWRMRGRLIHHRIEPSLIWLVGLVFGALIWVVGHVTATASVMQFGAVIGVIFTILSFIGARLGRIAWFPLFFLLLILPIGGSLVPYLTELTADALQIGLRILGIPVYREGEEFVLPTGRWSVIGACSGLRFILSAIVLSFLYAHLNFKKLSTSSIFIVLTLLASVFANWVRALLTVLMGHVTDMKYGPGEEHLWLGWVVFGVVMWAVFWIAARWRDVDDTDDGISVEKTAANSPLKRSPLSVLVFSILVAVAFNVGAKLLVMPASESSLQAFSAIHIADTGALAKLEYEPDFVGWSAIKRGVIKDEQSQFLMAYYEGQANTASMLSLVNQVIPADDKEGWKMRALTSREVADTGITIREFIATSGRSNFRVQYWYTVGGEHTVSPVKAKLLTLKKVSLGRGDGSILNLVVYRDLTAKNDSKDAALLKSMAAASSAFTSKRP
jgi:exosortase A